MYPASSTDTTRKPAWLRAKLPGGPGYAATRRLVDENKLHTVCQSAQCPNLGECWSRGTATVMILGNTLGSIRDSRGQLSRLPEAIAHYTTAVQLRPNYPEAHMNLGVALYLADRKAEALAPLETAVRLAPNNTVVRGMLETIRAELKK